MKISQMLSIFKDIASYRAVQLLSGPLLFFILVFYIFGVSENMQLVKNGQTADEGLHEVSQSLLGIKKVISQFQFDGSAVDDKSKFEKLIKQVDSRIYHYENVAAYNSVLSEKISDFKVVYNEWIIAEKMYAYQYSETRHSSLDRVNSHYLITEKNNIFLNAMQLLANTEKLIHDDIIRGQKTFYVIQWLVALIFVYFCFMALFYQRKSLRKHVIREKNLEMTLQSIGDAVIATDLHGNVTCMNPEAERLTGCLFENAKDCALSKIFRVINAYSGEPIDDLVEKVKRDGGVVVLTEDSTLIASNGSRYQIYENGAPIYDDAGLIIGVVLVFRDITQEHELRNCLNETALRLQRIIDSSLDAVIVTDKNGMIEVWNPAAEKMFGWSYEAIRKQPIHELIIPKELRERHLQGIQRLIEENKISFVAKRIESTAMHREGHTFPIELSMTSMLTGNGWVFNTYIRDLSDMKN